MTGELIEKLKAGRNLPDTLAISREINLLTLKDVRERAEALLADAEAYQVERCASLPDDGCAGIGEINQDFFSKYHSVRALFMSLQIDYIGTPGWMPKRLRSDYRIVGHTVEQEYLLGRTGSSSLFECAIDSPDTAPDFELASLYHAIVFYHQAYGEHGEK